MLANIFERSYFIAQRTQRKEKSNYEEDRIIGKYIFQLVPANDPGTQIETSPCWSRGEGKKNSGRYLRQGQCKMLEGKVSQLVKEPTQGKCRKQAQLKRDRKHFQRL